MALNDLPSLLDSLPGIRAMIETLKGDTGAVEIEGMTSSAKGFALARVFARLDRPLLVITYSQEQAQRLWDDLVRYGVPQDRVCTLPSSQSLFLEGDITDFRVIGERIGALLTLAQQEPCIVIGTLEAVLQRTSPPDGSGARCLYAGGWADGRVRDGGGAVGGDGLRGRQYCHPARRIFAAWRHPGCLLQRL